MNDNKKPKKEPKDRPLTQRQRAFVKDVIATKNPTEAVRRNYNIGGKGGKKNAVVARSIASENLTKPNIQNALQKELEKQGIDDGFLVGELKENIELSKKDGQYSTHLKGIELGARLKGHMKTSSKQGLNLNVIGFIDAGSLKDIDKEEHEVIDME